MTEFANGWDSDLATELAPIWVERKLISGSLIDVDELVTAAHGVLQGGASLSIPSITITPRSAPASP